VTAEAYWAYRNGSAGDVGTNIVPWGILIGGEALHNNHQLRSIEHENSSLA
jgi:fatty-acid desaturase